MSAPTMFFCLDDYFLFSHMVMEEWTVQLLYDVCVITLVEMNLWRIVAKTECPCRKLSERHLACGIAHFHNKETLVEVVKAEGLRVAVYPL